MSDIYILSNYGKLSKAGENILFTSAEQKQRIIQPFKTEMIVLYGKVSITADTFAILSKNRIPVYFMEKGKAQNIRLDYGDSKNVFLRQKQYRILDDEKKSAEIAGTIVAGKIKNQLCFMQRINRKNESEVLEKLIQKTKTILKKLSDCRNIEKIRGYEGAASKNYFAALKINLIPEWAVFETRSHRPPKSNVNAALSYIYSILNCRVQAALEAVGLDSMCGNLHELSYGKDCLAFDIMEEFRTPFADTLCCSLFNLGTLKKNDFEEQEDGVFLAEEGRAKIVEAVEEKLDTKIFHEELNEKLFWREIFFEQAKIYRETVMGDRKNYVPFLYR